MRSRLATALHCASVKLGYGGAPKKHPSTGPKMCGTPDAIVGPHLNACAHLDHLGAAGQLYKPIQRL